MRRFWKVFRFLLGFKKEAKMDFKDFRPEVIVMIPAFNEEKTIAETIKSIQNQTYPIKEIIVIDDFSTDKTGEIARSLGVKVIRTPYNTGTKAQAQNYGLKFIEDTDILVTVDADTILAKDAIEKILPSLKDPKMISACGFVVPQKVETFWERIRLIQYIIYIPLAKGTQDYWGTPLVSSGCFSAFNFKLLKELGGFPLKTFVEDMALSWQALLKGYKIKLVKEAICYPKDPDFWPVYRRQMLRWDRGFLQCLALYRKDLKQNPKLLFFVYWYFLTGLLSPLLWGTLIYSLYSLIVFRSLTNIFSFLGAAYLVEMTINLFYTIYYGKKLNILKQAISSFPCYLLSGFFDCYLFWESFVREWIIKSKMVWEKGH